MAKKKLHYSETVIYKSPPGVMAELRAVAYFRGKKGKLAAGAREVHMRGMESFVDSLTLSEQKRFREILESVRMAESMKVDQESPPSRLDFHSSQ